MISTNRIANWIAELDSGLKWTLHDCKSLGRCAESHTHQLIKWKWALKTPARKTATGFVIQKYRADHLLRVSVWEKQEFHIQSNIIHSNLTQNWRHQKEYGTNTVPHRAIVMMSHLINEIWSSSSSYILTGFLNRWPFRASFYTLSKVTTAFVCFFNL